MVAENLKGGQAIQQKDQGQITRAPRGILLVADSGRSRRRESRIDGFTDDLHREGLNPRAALPGGPGKARLLARLLKEALAIPVPFNWDLGQEDAPRRASGYQQPVVAYFDLVRGNVAERGEYGDLDVQVGQLLRNDRMKAGIVQRRRGGAFDHRLVKGLESLNDADAAAQPLYFAQCHESAAGFVQSFGGRFDLGLPVTPYTLFE
jgi:hypothetical protein